MAKEKTQVPLKMLKDPGHLLSLGLGSGLSPWAPGTMGTLVAMPFAILLQWYPNGVSLLILIAAFAIGVWLCGRTAEALGVHDHGSIVWDEWLGIGVTLWAQPAGLIWFVAGFALFRFFDIVKPWPIRWIDRKVSGGFGIMLDDLLAGIYAWLVLTGLVVWLT